MTRGRRIGGVALLLLCGTSLSMLQLAAQVRFDLVKPEVVQRRLDEYRGDDNKRVAALKQLFLDAGCSPEHLKEEAVPKRKQPNIICELPGSTDAVVVVGAHFDHVDRGSGIIDNWSGASLLPSLLQSMRGVPRTKTYVFVGFTGEEEGLLGSDFYVSQLPPADIAHIEEMVNLDTLGLGPMLVWNQQSDPVLLSILGQISKATNLPVAGMNLDGVGESDEESFIAQQVCTLTVHSVTPATWHVLHSTDDNPRAMHFDDYYKTYRLLASFLASLDAINIPKHVCTTKPVAMAGRGSRAPRTAVRR